MNQIEQTDAALPQTKRTVEVVTLEIRTLQRQFQQMALGYAIEVGRRLVEVKAMLPHGAWGNYLKTQVEYSQSTANNLMRIFEEYGADQQSLFGPVAKSQTLGNLPYTKALELLALPAEEREHFAQQQDVEAMSTRELREAIRAREASAAAAKAAEQARAKAEEDMRLANERLEGMNQEISLARQAVSEAENRAAGYQAKLADQQQQTAAAQEEAERLHRELEELRTRPVEVAVQEPDPEALDRARDEAARQARKEAEARLEEELKKAGEKLKSAKEQAKDLKSGLEQAQKELEHARLEAEKAKKALNASGNKEVAAFSVYFKNVQEHFEDMLGCLDRLEASGDLEHGEKLRKAVAALLENMKRQVENHVKM